MKIIYSDPLPNGEYPECLHYLLKDIKLLKRKFFFWIRHSETNEKQQYSLRYFVTEAVPDLIRLFKEKDFEGIRKLQTARPGQVGGMLSCRYVLSGKLACFQVSIYRPGQYGESVFVTPATAFIDDDTKRYVKYAQEFDQ